MSISKSAVLFGGALLLAASLNGCSSDTKEGGSPADVPKVDESTCAVCHSTSVSKVTGDNIYQDFVASNHFLVPNARSHYPEGIGCQGCHGGGAMHEGVGPIPFKNPDNAGNCFSCHKPYLPTSHYYEMTSGAGAQAAMYASKNYQSSCTSCHDPHKADKGIGQEHKDWAESGHGDPNGIAWKDRDFKFSVACIRCHTTTGYINYVNSDFTAATETWATEGDLTREVLTCKGCHTDFNFKNRIRAVPAVTAAYKENFESTRVDFPDCGASNICITCHAGRESGQSIRDAADSSFTNKSFVNPHYLAAAATLFAKGGYHFFSERVNGLLTYDNYSSGNGFNHGRIGMAGRISRPAPGTGSYGPCVACHLGATGGNGRSHTFDPKLTFAATDTCYGCHDEFLEEGGVAAVIEEQKEILERSLSFLEYNLNQKGIFYDSVHHPYFVKTAGADASVAANQLKDWTAVGPESGNPKNNMGAAFNFKILSAEKGSHVHNRTYTRRLIFDSAQYLQKGDVSYSNQALPNTGQSNLNNLITFSSYSAHVTPAGGGAPNDGNPVSISELKNYLVRSSGGKFFRR